MELSSLFQGSYKGKKVFVTGHTGFKGSWLCLWLTEIGAEVVGFSLPESDNTRHFDQLNLDIKDIRGDVRDLSRLKEVVKDSQPEIIFHLAAQPLVRLSYDEPVETFETNVMGTVNVLEAARNVDSLKAIVIVTTDKVYKDQDLGRGYKETDELEGRDPYSASKSCAEIVASSYTRSFFDEKKVLVATSRAGNVIGGGDWAKDRLIPDLVYSAEGKRKVQIRNPKATRPWQHVLEPLSGYLALGSSLLKGKYEYAKPWNFGPKQESSVEVEKVLEIFDKYWKADCENGSDQSNKKESGKLVLDSRQVLQELEWQNIWDLERSIKETVLWYKENHENAIIMSLQNLHAYIDDAIQSGVKWTK